MVWDELKPRASGRGGSVDARIYVSATRHNTRDRNQYSLCVYVDATRMKEYRLLIGDRATVLLDYEARIGMVVRRIDDGYKLCVPGKSSTYKAGTPSRGLLKSTANIEQIRRIWPSGEPYRWHTNDAYVADDGIVFALPPIASK